MTAESMYGDLLNMNMSDIHSIVQKAFMRNDSIPQPLTNDTDFCDNFLGASTEVTFAYKVNAYSSFIFVIIGLLGNFFSLLVFSSKAMRSNIFLLLLACSDSFYLLAVLFAKVLPVLRCFYFTSSTVDPYNNSDAWCKIFQFILDLCANYSTALILAFTVERFIAVYFPMRFKELCTVRRAKLICAVGIVVIAVLIAPYHFMFIVVLPHVKRCIVDPEHHTLLGSIYAAEMVIFRILPVIIIAVLNCTIITRLSLVSREKRRLKNSRTPVEAEKGKKASKKKQADEKNLQITVMLILVSTSYIIVFLPVMIIFIIDACLDDKDYNERYYIVRLYTATPYVIGFAINFFLYTISGRVFREQLMRILCEKEIRRRQQKNTTTNAQTVVSNCPEATTLV